MKSSEENANSDVTPSQQIADNDEGRAEDPSKPYDIGQRRIDMRERLREVELEATLRFGAREMTLGEVLDLGPGDVIELDRQVHDTVDLLVGDKIVARGIAVLSDGCYGLRITELAEAKLSLESVRCLF